MNITHHRKPLAMEFPAKDFDTWKDYKRRLHFSAARVGGDLEAAGNLLALHFEFSKFS